MPKVSVLTPVYKTPEKYLREAIESILNQTFSDFEFIILDDCPDDTREDIVKSYDDSRIKYHKNAENLGISKSRNKLIDLAQGEYLAVFDHDDISLPTRLEKQVEYLDTHPSVGVVGTRAEIFPGKGKFLITPVDGRKIKLCLCNGFCILHPSSMIRKSVLLEHGIRYEEEFSPAEDYRLWTRIMLYADFHELPEILFRYRMHESNTTKVQHEKMVEADCAVRAHVRCENPALHEEFMELADRITKVRLFGIPGLHFLTIVKHRSETSVFLFKKIKILSIVKRLKL